MAYRRQRWFLVVRSFRTLRSVAAPNTRLGIGFHCLPWRLSIPCRAPQAACQTLPAEPQRPLLFGARASIQLRPRVHAPIMPPRPRKARAIVSLRPSLHTTAGTVAAHASLMASYPHPDGSGSGGDGKVGGQNCGGTKSETSDTAAVANAGERTTGASGRETRKENGKSGKPSDREVAAKLREAKLCQQALDNALPGLPPPKKVVLVDSGAALTDAHEALSACNVLGLDTETQPRFKVGVAANPPALLQIAGMRIGSAAAGGDEAVARDAPVYVFDLLTLLPTQQEGWAPQFSRILAPLLASPETLLLGVGIEQDLCELARHYGSRVPCLLEVARGVVDLGSAKCKGGQGLRRLLAEYAGFRLVKSQATSNWAKRPLSTKQLAYAANDARAALMVYTGAGSAAFNGKPGDVACGEVAIAECRFCGSRGLKAAAVECKKDCGWAKWRDEEAKRYLAKGPGGIEEAEMCREGYLSKSGVPEASFDTIEVTTEDESLGNGFDASEFDNTGSGEFANMFSEGGKPHYRRVLIPVCSNEMLVLEEADRKYRVKNHAAKKMMDKKRKREKLERGI